MKAIINSTNKMMFEQHHSHLEMVDDGTRGKKLGLTPLGEMPDELAKQLAHKMLGMLSHRDKTHVMRCEVNNGILMIKISNVKYQPQEKAIYKPVDELSPEITDYLRFLGYAVPWRGISVQEMIDAGWVVMDYFVDSRVSMQDVYNIEE